MSLSEGKLRIKFHDETEEVRRVDEFEVRDGVLRVWRTSNHGRFAEAWYPLNSLRGWERIDG